MDQNTQSQDHSPLPPQPAQQSGSAGALAAAVIIVVLLAAGGFYFLYTQQHSANDTEAPQATEQGSDVQSDSIERIESDLEATQSADVEADVSGLEEAL